MITIQFRDRNDALNIYDQLIKGDLEHNLLYLHLIYEPENLLKITWDHHHPSFIENKIIPILTNYILTVIEGKWMKEMIRTLFYYTDIEEQQQILSMARTIMDGDRRDLPEFYGEDLIPNRREMISTAFSSFLTSNLSFSFEAFLQFRLKDYRNKLLQFVESAIDEYKFEQEYQTFIENLRNYVYSKECSMNSIHLLDNKKIIFFDTDFTQIEDDLLKNMIDQNLHYVEELDLESLVLAPLISLAPKEVHIYSDDADQGIIQTIQNIFLERVSLHAKHKFYEVAVK